MKRIWVILLILTFLSIWHKPMHAISFDNVPLDQQIDSKVPAKRDPLQKPEKPKKIVKTISYEGLWHIQPKSTSCQREIDDFKIRVSGNKIDTVVGMTVEGNIKNDGSFAMTSKSNYWSIEFIGQLKEDSGQANWVRKTKPSGQCSGTIKIVRLKS